MAGRVGMDASSGGLTGGTTMRSDLEGLVWRWATDKLFPNHLVHYEIGGW